MKSKNARIGRPILTLLVLLAAAAGLRAQTSAVVKEISTRKDADRLVVHIKVEGTFTHEVSVLPAPPRLIVDVTPASQNQAAPYTQVDDLGILAIRTGQFKPETVRIVFDLARALPAQNVALGPDGLVVSFWYEGGIPPVPAAEPAVPAAPQRKEEIRREPSPRREPALPGRSEFFISGRAGMSLYLNPELAVQKDFTLYAEAGTLDEIYTFGSSPSYALQFGKYFGRTKAGVEIALGSHRQNGVFTANMPHPYMSNALRAVEFESSDLKDSTLNIYAFALFPMLETEKIGLSAGPMLGLSMGKFQSLEDYDFSETSPYAASDVVIEGQTYVEDKYTELVFGGLLSLEYRLSQKLALVFDARLIYLNPKIVSLGQRANMLQVQPVLGLQFNF